MGLPSLFFSLGRESDKSTQDFRLSSFKASFSFLPTPVKFNGHTLLSYMLEVAYFLPSLVKINVNSMMGALAIRRGKDRLRDRIIMGMTISFGLSKPLLRLLHLSVFEGSFSLLEAS